MSKNPCLHYTNRALALFLGLIASHSAYAGDLDGIETLIGIAIALFGLTMLCWIFALVNTIRLLKNKPYAQKYLVVAQTLLVLVGLFVLMLYQGKIGVQVFGSLFFFAPVIIHLVGTNRKRKRQKKTGCPVCHDQSFLSFSIEILNNEYDANINSAEKIGDTQTYQCADCQSVFFRQADQYEKFAKGQIETLREFVKRDLIMDESLKVKQSKIGLSKDWNGNQYAPVKVTLKNGDTLDFVTLRISKNPPIGFRVDFYEQVIFLDEVADIEPSAYGVPLEIRKKGENAKEMRMGFYPTTVLGPKNEKIVLNGQVLFFQNQNIKGEDLVLDTADWIHTWDYLYDNEVTSLVLLVAKA